MIKKGLDSLANNVYPGLETVVFCGFTSQEQAELSDMARRSRRVSRRHRTVEWGMCRPCRLIHLLTLRIRSKLFGALAVPWGGGR